jgi:hypothetical protein
MHPFWRDSLRLTDLISTITAITLHPIRGVAAITIIWHPVWCTIGVGSGDGWGRGVHSRRWRDFNVGSILCTHLLFFIRVTEDDDIAVVGWPEKPMVEVTEELLEELLIP